MIVTYSIASFSINQFICKYPNQFISFYIILVSWFSYKLCLSHYGFNNIAHLQKANLVSQKLCHNNFVGSIEYTRHISPTFHGIICISQITETFQIGAFERKLRTKIKIKTRKIGF